MIQRKQGQKSFRSRDLCPGHEASSDGFQSFEQQPPSRTPVSGLPLPRWRSPLRSGEVGPGHRFRRCVNSWTVTWVGLIPGRGSDSGVSRSADFPRENAKRWETTRSYDNEAPRVSPGHTNYSATTENGVRSPISSTTRLCRSCMATTPGKAVLVEATVLATGQAGGDRVRAAHRARFQRVA